MSSDRCWTDADGNELARLIAVPTAGLSARVQDADHQMAAAILDHLTAAGWHPPQQDRIGAALADLDQIPALHRRGVSHRDECGTCSEPYPCGTVQAVIRIYRTLTGEDADG